MTIPTYEQLMLPMMKICNDGNYEIYTMNADGTNQTNISNNPSTDEYVPAWSPDGTKIAHQHRSDDDANYQIFVTTTTVLTDD
tara:strand:+ start:2094 stop:2342 length:249 start_codon:yes stop_codon:yes gene_type:complete